MDGELPCLKQGPQDKCHPLQHKVGSIWSQSLLAGRRKERSPVTGNWCPVGSVVIGASIGHTPYYPFKSQTILAGAWGKDLERWVMCDTGSRHGQAGDVQRTGEQPSWVTWPYSYALYFLIFCVNIFFAVFFLRLKVHVPLIVYLSLLISVYTAYSNLE